MTILEHNVETNEVIERELTTEELAQRATDKALAENRIAEAEAKATARQAVLDRLGITEEEAALLLSL